MPGAAACCGGGDRPSRRGGRDCCRCRSCIGSCACGRGGLRVRTLWDPFPYCPVLPLLVPLQGLLGHCAAAAAAPAALQAVFWVVAQTGVAL